MNHSNDSLAFSKKITKNTKCGTSAKNCECFAALGKSGHKYIFLLLLLWNCPPWPTRLIPLSPSPSPQTFSFPISYPFPFPYPLRWGCKRHPLPLYLENIFLCVKVGETNNTQRKKKYLSDSDSGYGTGTGWIWIWIWHWNKSAFLFFPFTRGKKFFIPSDPKQFVVSVEKQECSKFNHAFRSCLI